MDLWSGYQLWINNIDHWLIHTWYCNFWLATATTINTYKKSHKLQPSWCRNYMSYKISNARIVGENKTRKWYFSRENVEQVACQYIFFLIIYGSKILEIKLRVSQKNGQLPQMFLVLMRVEAGINFAYQWS